MKCYRCGNFLYESDRCPSCGADVRMYKKIVKRSNKLYNRGLEYARERNLSRAAECLTASLKAYKGNVNARNLLGLIYFETGEYTLAMSQWVISRGYQTEGNLAGDYLGAIQSSRADLDLIRMTIKKYNKAVEYVRQGNFDLASIQLKKLLNDNPNLLKGYLLLALLLIKKEKYLQARTTLKKAQRLDEGNDTVITYMNAVNEAIKEEEERLSGSEKRTKRVSERPIGGKRTRPLSGDDVIIPKSSYSEYSPRLMAVIQIVIGLIIGAALIFFVVVPAKTRALRSEAQSEQTKLEAQIAELTEEKESLESSLSESEGENSAALSAYSSLAEAADLYLSEDYSGCKDILDGMDQGSLEGDMAELYDKLYESAQEAAGSGSDGTADSGSDGTADGGSDGEE